MPFVVLSLISVVGSLQQSELSIYVWRIWLYGDSAALKVSRKGRGMNLTGEDGRAKSVRAEAIS
jgi:hypothetical protein